MIITVGDGLFPEVWSTKPPSPHTNTHPHAHVFVAPRELPRKPETPPLRCRSRGWRVGRPTKATCRLPPVCPLPTCVGDRRQNPPSRSRRLPPTSVSYPRRTGLGQRPPNPPDGCSRRCLFGSGESRPPPFCTHRQLSPLSPPAGSRQGAGVSLNAAQKTMAFPPVEAEERAALCSAPLSRAI
jgi:hypothetical protein